MSIYIPGELQYALAKQVPAMERGFSILTDYGPIYIDAAQSALIIVAVRKALENTLANDNHLCDED